MFSFLNSFDFFCSKFAFLNKFEIFCSKFSLLNSFEILFQTFVFEQFSDFLFQIFCSRFFWDFRASRKKTKDRNTCSDGPSPRSPYPERRLAERRPGRPKGAPPSMVDGSRGSYTWMSSFPHDIYWRRRSDIFLPAG